MNRRQLLGAVALSAATRPPMRAAAKAPTLRADVVRLNLRHTWTTTMSSSDFRDTLHVAYTADGVTGRGEGAPIVRYKESAADGARALESIRATLTSADPWHFHKLMADVAKSLPGQYAAKSALDIALHDWLGQRLGIPLYRHFGLDPADAPLTTFSIGIDTPEKTKEKVREAEPFPRLKIKVGLDQDDATLDAVRSVTQKPILMDANEGFKSKEEAVRKINEFEKLGAFLVEQPLPAAMVEEHRWIRSRVHIPIIADEACLRPEDIPKIAGSFDGINVKLDKCGGLLEAMRMIQTARSHGLKVMLGCMVSSSVTITAAAHLSPLVDYADLDGNLLIANDPYRGVTVEKGQLVLPNRPGLGLVRA